MCPSGSRLREIPQVSAIIEDARLGPLLAGCRREWMMRLVQRTLADLRTELAEERGPARTREELLDRIVGDLIAEFRRLTSPAWTRVLNGTGVVVHTNLGRSNLPAGAAAAMAAVASHNTDLEFDLASGLRGHRGRRVEEKAALLAGAEDALVVNNNAAAIWMAVRHCAGGGRVVISRGEIVAIGGSFRLHEILAETGCELVEVGTTNRTDLQDYAAALAPATTVLKVHRSNFSVEGFTAETGLGELVELCRGRGCPVIYDAGSGILHPTDELGLPPGETVLAEDLATGVDLVTCSGDKLLGGCQAGFVLGRRETVAALRAHPMRRAFRVDKTTLAGLDAVLGAYLAAEGPPDLPTLACLGVPAETLRERAEGLLVQLVPAVPDGWQGRVEAGRSSVGGGSFSTADLATWLVVFSGPKEELEACHRALRLGRPALVGRMNQDGLAVDLRSLTDDELPLVAAAFRAAWKGSGPDVDRTARRDRS